MTEDDDPSGELIRMCENNPEEGLAWIARLDDDLRAHPRIRFAAFLAYRSLCFSRFFEAGQSSLLEKSDLEMMQWFGGDEIDAGRNALKVIAQIEADDPSYLSGLGFPEAMIDQVAQVVERTEPGATLEDLGWTKLLYVGSERLKTAPTYRAPASDGAVANAVRMRLSGVPAFQTVLIESDTSKQATFYLLRDDISRVANVGEAGLLGTLTVRQDGTFDFDADEDENVHGISNLQQPHIDRSGLDHPQRERLLSECSLLLQYEEDEAKRKYMREMMDWLEGRGSRPGRPPNEEINVGNEGGAAKKGCAASIAVVAVGVSAVFNVASRLI